VHDVAVRNTAAVATSVLMYRFGISLIRRHTLRDGSTRRGRNFLRPATSYK